MAEKLQTDNTESGSIPAQSRDLTVLYDGSCPLCQREIAHVRGLAERQPRCEFVFKDISSDAQADVYSASDREVLMARFHVELSDGTRLDGARAFVAMWERLPGWRWLARFSKLPGMIQMMEGAYRGFLKVRPTLQKLAGKRA